MRPKPDKKNYYRVTEVKQAKEIALNYLKTYELENALDFGLPEIDDRYHIWRVPLRNGKEEGIGEVTIDALTSLIVEKKTTRKEVLESRLLGRKIKRVASDRVMGEKDTAPSKKNNGEIPKYSTLKNTVGLGDSEELLQEMPAESIDLIFTSPPYYNARPEYADYITYEEYLLKMRKVIHQCHRILNEGRFFIINISPVLIRRANRNEASKRIAVPFDFHRIFIEEGFEFIDDIHWVKPEGAGWATGRGRRFAADRNPLQYKAVPVTEYILVYRKKTDKLIDWHIKNADPKILQQSKIEDGYEKTNLWKIHPAFHKTHPAVFPVELAEKVITYYSFKNDVVLDPFAGTGTVGEASVRLNRRFVLFELSVDYMEILKNQVESWLQSKASDVNWINVESPSSKLFLF
ncbi:MAG: site-specific DNA-methyltransferase [Cytophagaceae bacterium]|nr:site-specific DNA-methyltransferase [Cytophagaceae bacterium]